MFGSLKYKNGKNFKNIFFCFQKSISKTMPSAILSFLYHYEIQISLSKTMPGFLILFLAFELWPWVSNYSIFFQWSNFGAQYFENEENLQKLPDTVFETNVCRLTWQKNYKNTKVTFCAILFWKKPVVFQFFSPTLWFIYFLNK